ncbi:hypothetical protein CRG98_009925 [Punica granatum]|uniref:Uncharacterized protein n=1 Tax=Punica granatum TaxID=22663 RepID=A0A2I0KME7_PUNGR|nr:hypothetical protein CRG98_009925 [Punica granatum]
MASWLGLGEPWLAVGPTLLGEKWEEARGSIGCAFGLREQYTRRPRLEIDNRRRLGNLRMGLS